jgi:hypothetical protein
VPKATNAGDRRKSTLNLALDYIALNPNRYLFPVRPSAKFPPMVRDNLKVASNSPAQIRAWHERFPTCNWGLALSKSRVLVVDVDSKPGKIGQATFDALDLMYGWPATETVRTPSGGSHLYYDGVHIFALGEHGFGKDVDSPNYVLIAGCRLKDGSCYRVVPSFDGISRASQPAPFWFYDILRGAQEKIADAGEPAVDLDQPENIKWAEDFLRSDESGRSVAGDGGEYTMLMVAMALRDMAISQPRAVEIINDIYNVPDKCDPVWEFEELAKKIANGYAYASRNKIGGRTAEAEFADDEPETIQPHGDPAKIAKQAAERAKAKADEANGITPRKPRRTDKKRRNSLKRAAAMATPYGSKSNG